MFKRRETFYLVLAVFLIGCWQSAIAQTLPRGPQVLTFFSDVDDSEQPYGLYLPRKFNSGKKYPLVIMLHGAGSNHRLSLKRIFGKSNLPGETDVEATRYFPEWPDVEYIVASPYARGTMGYQGIAEKDVHDVLSDVKRRFPVDEDRIYLTGLSMGGGGTMWIGLSRPDIWAALAPVCPAPPEGTVELAPNALHIPVHFFQGGADPVVRPEGTREWVQRLKDLDTKVEYAEYPGVGHNSWENAYKDGAIFKWFGQFRRNRHPDRVRFASSRYKYNSAYWVKIDQLTPGTPATVDARFTGTNRIEIQTSGTGGLTLNLGGHPRLNPSRPIEVVVDGENITARVKDSLSLSRRNGKWYGEPYQAPAGSKRAGAEGPLSEAVAGRHVYVYGSGGNPSPEELQARREQAEHAANWSVYRGWFLGRVMVFPRVLADRDVRPSDLESSNLILFGTGETNGIIAKFSDRLPLEFNTATEKGYGLIYIFPISGHYVVVSSGLPWWSGLDQPTGPPAPSTTRRRFSFLGGPANSLLDLKDYVLFKGSLESVVVDGRFDYDWRVQAADAEKLKASGAVFVK